MPHHFHLNRSFDTQLSPAAASIIDWAPTARGGPAGAFNAPVSAGSAGSAVEAPARGLDLASLSGAGKLTSLEELPGVRPLRWCTRQLLVNSCAVVPLFSRGTFSVNAGLLASLGVAGGGGDVHSQLAGFHANDVLQLEGRWGKRRWAGIFNMVCLSWMSNALPLFELITVTPRTDSSMQADRLMFNWSGFWRMYVADDRSRRDSLISMNSPAEGSAADLTVTSSAGPRHHHDVDGATDAVKGRRVFPTGAHTLTSGGGSNHGNGADVGKKMKATCSSSGGSVLTEDVMTDAAVECGARTCGEVTRSVPQAGAELRPEVHRTGRWWRIQELRCGIGVALKNDIVSAANAYFGYSIHMGRALTFSSHLDVLRRGCYSVTCSTEQFDLAARLRVNHITSHLTELDTGVSWRPLRHVPGLTCRLSHSMGRTSVGLSVRGISSQEHQPANCTETPAQGSPAVGTPASLRTLVDSKGTLWRWWECAMERGVGAYHSVVGFITSAPAGVATTGQEAAAQTVAAESGGYGRGHITGAVVTGVNYCKTSVMQAKWDLTVGVATHQARESRALKFFLVLSAY